jgi:polyhydroxybutyrate depolymerase
MPTSQAPAPRLKPALVALWLTAALAACGGGGAATVTPAPSPVPAPAPAPQPAGSAGCGSAAQLATGERTITSDGVQRSYWLELPAGYDRNKAYPVVIGLHWRDGSATEVRTWNNFFGLKPLYGNNAIFIAPQGLNAGWANDGGRDIRFMRALITQVQQGTCTDPQRVFATGFSFGGMMSNAIGCEMGDVVRAIAPMAGSLWSGCNASAHRVAAIFDHAEDDNGVPYWAGVQARDEFVKRNSCSATTVPIGNNGCVEYQGCAAGKPVVWCGHPTGGHWPPAFSAGEIKAFFDRF